jgi:hypothetical protein
MSSPLILQCLKERFKKNKIYTNVGTILISLNPYERLPIYDNKTIQRLVPRMELSHVSPVAFNAFTTRSHKLTFLFLLFFSGTFNAAPPRRRSRTCLTLHTTRSLVSQLLSTSVVLRIALF